MTVRDLVRTALLKLGVLPAGQDPSGQQGADGVRCLNSLLDAFPLERHLIYTVDRQLFALVSGTQTYTVGPGGTWNTTPLYGAGSPRPQGMEAAYWQDPDVPNTEIPVYIMTDEEFQRLPARTLASTVAQRLYYKPEVPLGSVFVWPKPTRVANMVLYLQHPFNAQTALASTLVFPPGYQRMLEYGLAVELGSEYPSALRPELITLADEAKQLVKRGNFKPKLMTSDLAGVMRQSGTGRLYSGWGRWLAGEE